MNDKKLNELFDIEAAKSVYRTEVIDSLDQFIGDILKAATKDREYQLVPEECDWEGEEELAVGMWVSQVGSNKGYWRVAAIGDGTCACYVGKTNTLTLLPFSCLKPIPPKPKKIDHSSLIREINELELKINSIRDIIYAENNETENTN